MTVLRSSPRGIALEVRTPGDALPIVHSLFGFAT